MTVPSAQQQPISVQEIQKRIAHCKLDPPVEVRPSKRHGRGVFATRDIRLGMPVAYYDGEVLQNGHTIDMDQHEYSLEYPESWLDEDTERLTCIGYKEPRTTYGCAQLINDSLRPDLDGLVDQTSGKIKWNDCTEEMEKYTRVSHKLSSVYIDPRKECKGWLFARRDIRQGEELVNHYGETYWLRQMATTSRRLAVVLSIFALYEQEYMSATDPTEEQSYNAVNGYNGLWEALVGICKDDTWKSMTKRQLITLFMKESLIF